MLTVKHLRKSFGTVLAVNDVSFSVASGQILGLLGPNGAGKTTTVSMVAGLLTPDRGEVLIAGERLAGDTDPSKRRIGLVPQDLALYDEPSGRANLPLFGALYNLTGRPHGPLSLAGRLSARPGRPLDRAINRVLRPVALAGRPRDAREPFSGGRPRR